MQMKLVVYHAPVVWEFINICDKSSQIFTLSGCVYVCEGVGRLRYQYYWSVHNFEVEGW